MAKIKKLTRKHLIPRWMRRLLGIKERRPRMSDISANIDEMHEVPVEPVEFDALYFDCPVCGTRKYMKIPKPHPDGRTIEKIIFDEFYKS